MRVAVFNTKSFEKPFLSDMAGGTHDLVFFEMALTERTAALAEGFPAVCAFANDVLDESVLRELASGDTRFVALRCAGFNQVDLRAAERLGIVMARVPAYSPESVAEHTLALIFSLNRKIHRAYARVREGNFSLDGLMGFTLSGKTVGVVGTGRIGSCLAKMLVGLGCRVVASDPERSPECEALGVEYVEFDALLECSDIVSLNCPLTPTTRHLIGDDEVLRMKAGGMLINTSRGAVVDTGALIRGLKSGHLGSVGLDVYEEEADLFFQDLSDQVIQDDVFARLLTFPNVLITAHQAFFTREALLGIAQTTARNLDGFERGDVPAENLVTTALLASRPS